MSEISAYIDDRAVKNMIDSLDKRLQRKIMLPAMRKGVKAIEKEARAKAPIRKGSAIRDELGRFTRRSGRGSIAGGTLKKSIRSSAKRGKTADTVVAKVYVSQVKEGDINPAKYAHLVEFGTTHSTPKPFMRPARDSAGPKAIQITTDEAIKNLNKAL